MNSVVWNFLGSLFKNLNSKSNEPIDVPIDLWQFIFRYFETVPSRNWKELTCSRDSILSQHKQHNCALEKTILKAVKAIRISQISHKVVSGAKYIYATLGMFTSHRYAYTMECIRFINSLMMTMLSLTRFYLRKIGTFKIQRVKLVVTMVHIKIRSDRNVVLYAVMICIHSLSELIWRASYLFNFFKYSWKSKTSKWTTSSRIGMFQFVFDIFFIYFLGKNFFLVSI